VFLFKYESNVNLEEEGKKKEKDLTIDTDKTDHKEKRREEKRREKKKEGSIESDNDTGGVDSILKIFKRS